MFLTSPLVPMSILCVFLKRLLPLDGFKHKDYEDECMYVCMYVTQSGDGSEFLSRATPGQVIAAGFCYSRTF